MEVVRLSEKFSRFSEHWSPKIVGTVNDMHVKLVKLSGEFVWHHHEKEDELFLVIEGRLRVRFREGDVDVGPGEFIGAQWSGALPRRADARGPRCVA